MDKVRAEALEKELKDTEIAGWKIGDLLGNGASGAVFSAVKGEQTAALKVIDKEMEERYGLDQEARVKMENQLSNKHHPNLVKIYQAGRCEKTGFLFIAMEKLSLETLTKKIPNLPADKIPSILSQLASAAKFLEECGFCHRDIKPDNIVVSSDYEHAVLLDFGILRPLAESENGTGESFIGTTRYSPPEFVMRDEAQTPEGYRAITFYQLGAVLHDMLTKKRMFSHITNPPAKVIDAVRNEDPVIDCPNADMHLVSLAKSCLMKSPQARLSLVKWEDFSGIKDSADDLAKVKARLRETMQVRKNETETATKEIYIDKRKTLEEIAFRIDTFSKEIWNQSKLLPPMAVEFKVSSKQGEVQITIKSGPSSEHGLEKVLIMLIKANFIADANGAMIISGQTFVEDISSDTENVHEIYKGIIDGPELKRKLDWFLHKSLETAQIAGPSSYKKPLKFK